MEATNSPSIIADGVSLAFAGANGLRTVLAEVSFQVGEGARVGLIGENGAGKSTLVRIIAGDLEADAGRLSRPVSMGYLPQEVASLPYDTVADVWAAAAAPARQAVARLEAAAQALTDDGKKEQQAYADALADAELIDAWDVDVRIGRAMAGLGFTQIDQTRRLDTISGGQLRRLWLGALLVERPAALVLDEPTNHLDDAAVDYLSAELAGWRGPVVAASHDRAFLNRVCTALVDLDPAVSSLSGAPETSLSAGAPAGRGATWFGGSLDEYLGAKRRARDAWERRFEEEQTELKRLRTAVRDSQSVGHANWKPRTEQRAAAKFYADRNATVVSKRVRDARNRLTDLEAAQVRKPPPELRLRVPPGSGSGGDAGMSLVWAHEVTIPGTGGLFRLDQVAAGVPRIDIVPGDRLLLAGENGTGKSTLLAVLAGDLDPAAIPGAHGSSGRVGRTRVGLLEQETALDGESRTARELIGLARGTASSPDEDQRGDGMGLVAPRDLDRPVGELSLGQRRRVLLAMLLSQRLDVLLLDEPTNHLSLAVVDQLFAALEGWHGAVVVATHDRWLRSTWAGEQLTLTTIHGGGTSEAVAR